MNLYINQENFKGINYSVTPIKKGEYVECTFTDCNFSEVHVSNIVFEECRFINCNFSNAFVKNTSFKTVQFESCKLLGVKFNECNPFLLSFQFTDCQLDFSNFYQLQLQNTVFKNCNLEEVDFTETNLLKAVFEQCNLKSTVFEDTNLEKADFRTAYNFVINPKKNTITKAKFSLLNVSGLLADFNIVIE